MWCTLMDSQPTIPGNERPDPMSRFTRNGLATTHLYDQRKGQRDRRDSYSCLNSGKQQLARDVLSGEARGIC